MSACSASRCELTETYSPAAIDRAPATSPAVPAVTTALVDSPAAATPSTRLAVDTMPSLAPRTAARSQPARWLRCTSAALVGGRDRAPWPGCGAASIISDRLAPTLTGAIRSAPTCALMSSARSPRPTGSGLENLRDGVVTFTSPPHPRGDLDDRFDH